MGVDPNAQAPSKYGDFAAGPPAPPEKTPKVGASRRPPKRLLIGLAAVAVIAAAAVGYFVLKPGEDAGSAATGGRRGATGTLAAVKGSTLTLKTGAGTSMKVTTSKSTVITKAVLGSVEEIKVGDNVVVTGVPSGPNAIRAERVVDNGNLPGGQGGPRRGGPGRFDSPAEGGFMTGTVESVTGRSFVVTDRFSPPVTVTLGDAAVVSVVKVVPIKELTIGQPVVVNGTSKDEGTIEAASVQQGAAGFGRDPRIGPRGGVDAGGFNGGGVNGGGVDGGLDGGLDGGGVDGTGRPTP